MVQTGVRSQDDAKRRSERLKGVITENDDTRTSSAWMRSDSLGRESYKEGLGMSHKKMLMDRKERIQKRYERKSQLPALSCFLCLRLHAPKVVYE